MVSTHIGQLIVNKGGKNIQCRKDSFFSKHIEKAGHPTHKSVKLEHSLTLYTHIKKFKMA